MTRCRAKHQALCQLQVVHDLDQMRDLQVLQAWEDGCDAWDRRWGNGGTWMIHVLIWQGVRSNKNKEHEFYFSIYRKCHHPNWQTHIISERKVHHTHQPEMIMTWVSSILGSGWPSQRWALVILMVEFTVLALNVSPSHFQMILVNNNHKDENRP